LIDVDNSIRMSLDFMVIHEFLLRIHVLNDILLYMNPLLEKKGVKK